MHLIAPQQFEIRDRGGVNRGRLSPSSQLKSRLFLSLNLMGIGLRPQSDRSPICREIKTAKPRN
ncbi:MAG: hypothetical protein D6680_08245 [Cyanobacteria bacterium J007]|nr:MAG: hypothetical protein D6680_08245 [Cyanobacteria bacterium J007]